MSTHIYNAFRIKKSFDELFEEIQGWKKEAKEKAEELKCKEFSEQAVGELDNWCLHRAGIKSSSSDPKLSADNPALYQAWNKVREETLEAQKEGRSSAYDWGLEISLFKVSKTTWLIQPHAQSEAMTRWANQKIKSIGGTEFEYWDNSDHPEHITPSQWASRKGVWDKIFKDTSIPREAGLNMVLNSPQLSMYLIPSEERVTDLQRSFEERVQAQWLEMGWEIVYQKMLNDVPPGSTTSMSMIMRSQREAQKGEWDKDGVCRSRIEKALFPHYRAEHLTKMAILEIDFDRHYLQQTLSQAEASTKPRL